MSWQTLVEGLAGSEFNGYWARQRLTVTDPQQQRVDVVFFE